MVFVFVCSLSPETHGAPQRTHYKQYKPFLAPPCLQSRCSVFSLLRLNIFLLQLQSHKVV